MWGGGTKQKKGRLKRTSKAIRSAFVLKTSKEKKKARGSEVQILKII